MRLMKILLTAAVIICAVQTVSAQDWFTGKVVMEMLKDEESIGKMVVSITEEKFCFAFSSAEFNSKMIYDGESLYEVYPDQKMYYTYKVELPGKDSDTVNIYEDDSFYFSGNTKEILGYECEEWIMEELNHIWLAKDFSRFFYIGEMMSEKYAFIYHRGYFPFEMVSESVGSNPVFRSIVTEIDPDAEIDEAVFVIPDNYKKEN